MTELAAVAHHFEQDGMRVEVRYGNDREQPTVFISIPWSPFVEAQAPVDNPALITAIATRALELADIKLDPGAQPAIHTYPVVDARYEWAMTWHYDNA